MNIQDWPINRIMQLPDCSFGQRWLVGVGMQTNEQVVHFDISELGLPEKAVIWELCIYQSVYATFQINLSLALGDQLPTTDDEFDAMEPLFRNMWPKLFDRYTLQINRLPAILRLPMRKLVRSSGRRLIGRFLWSAATLAQIQVHLVVSSVPTEVPDWLVSARG